MKKSNSELSLDFIENIVCIETVSYAYVEFLLRFKLVRNSEVHASQ